MAKETLADMGHWLKTVVPESLSPAKPVRLQRSRAKGSRLTSPNGLPVVCVTRGTKWGNPLPLSATADAAERRAAVARFRRSLFAGTLPFTIGDVQRELRGKNLACWCKESPCHADVLLELANG